MSLKKFRRAWERVGAVVLYIIVGGSGLNGLLHGVDALGGWLAFGAILLCLGLLIGAMVLTLPSEDAA